MQILFNVDKCLHTKITFKNGHELYIWIPREPKLCFGENGHGVLVKGLCQKTKLYTNLGTICAWTTLTDFCWKCVGTI